MTPDNTPASVVVVQALEPCPFCGGVDRWHGPRFIREGTLHRVMCWGCNARTGAAETREEVAEAWNMRHRLAFQQPFACSACRQSLPEPTDCGWPTCGCDPYADKVIASLEESGAFQQPGGEAPSCVACEDSPKAPNMPCAVCGKGTTPDAALRSDGTVERMIRAMPEHAKRDWVSDPIQETERDWMRLLAISALSAATPSQKQGEGL